MKLRVFVLFWTVIRIQSMKGAKLFTVDALKHMKEGTSMLKYCRRGYPHFRQFELTPDASSIRWCYKTKSLQKHMH
eukprot:TRINITY_DN13961_c0_g1_i1.p1 TRINITY_DN13961_c0_g1~~TRINITY_DN13961_c0_g1_i1.p1  ORF type:complete len:76 (-),score=9.95 TRINITY_DN13961_c0_g1_i1:260-487(-)